MARAYFVAGTDTGVGKTAVTLALMQGFKARGLAVAGMKPVASGCVQSASGLRNEDAQRIRAAASMPLAYATVNPYGFLPAIAPHIAARQAGVGISFERIEADLDGLARGADVVLVEGVGGWRVPLDDVRGMDDLAIRLGLPVVLVIGLRLGCLNHALLTHEAILHSGLACAGWVANQVDGEMAVVEENIATLRERLSSPCLGYVPCLAGAEATAVVDYLDFSRLRAGCAP